LLKSLESAGDVRHLRVCHWYNNMLHETIQLTSRPKKPRFSAPDLWADLPPLRRHGYGVCAVLAVGLLADIFVGRIDWLSRSWPDLAADAYLVGIVIAAIRIGVIGGLTAAALATICHLSSASAGIETAFYDGSIVRFGIVAIVAGWLSHRQMKDQNAPKTAVSQELSRAGLPSPGFEHEFRTPLASIEGAASLLEDRALSFEKRTEFTRIIRKECRRLDDVLESIGSVAGGGSANIGLQRRSLGSRR